MGFVHYNIGDLEDGKVGLEKLGLEAFRGEVEEAVVSVGGVVQGKVHLPAAHAGMDGDGPDTPCLEVLHLVFHEGDQGRDHQCQAFLLHENRHLEADALAAAGRENGQHVPALGCLPDYLLLHGTEAVIAPIPF